MDMDKNMYKKYARAHAPKSSTIKNCVKAFVVGGIICSVGQGLLQLYGEVFLLPEEDAAALTSVSLVFAAVLLTALGIFDKIAKCAGAGTLVPITGFSNAVVSPAMEFKTEGMVLGMASKMFVVAGPVIVYGTISSIIAGMIYYFFIM